MKFDAVDISFLVIVSLMTYLSYFVFRTRLNSTYRKGLTSQRQRIDALENRLSSKIQGQGSAATLSDQKSEDEPMPDIDIMGADEPMAILGLDLIFRKVNPALAARIGLVPKQMIGQDCRKFITEDSSALLKEREEKRREKKGEDLPSNFRVEFLWKGVGPEKILLENTVSILRDRRNKAVEFLVIYHDLTEEDRREREKTVAQKVSEELLRGLSDMTLVLNADEIICDVRPQRQNILGYKKEGEGSVVGENISNLIHERDAQILQSERCFKHSLESPENHRIHEARFLKKTGDGENLYVSCQAIIIGHEDATITVALIASSRLNKSSQQSNIIAY